MPEQQQKNKRIRRKRYEPPTEEVMEYGKRFAAWLRGMREMRGLNKNQLAAKSGVSATWIGLLENDGINNQNGQFNRVSARTVRKLATALETDPVPGLRAAGLPIDDEPDVLGRVLPTGDMFGVNPEDTQPELTIAAVGAFLLAWRKNLQKVGNQGEQVAGLAPGANNQH